MTLYQSMAIAGMGLDTQVERLQIHTTNMANIGTPGYVRKIPVLVENANVPFDALLSKMRTDGPAAAMAASTPQGVQLLEAVDDPTPGKKIYQPNHPLADEQGFVTMSNTNPMGDMADAMVANRMYEANLALYGVTKAMASKALELGQAR